nr:hypothetical protein Iba_chr05cCG3590 [Ipomoea batatas]GMC99029.1 hypothetical protein Iba_chr05eCG1830 [Ipomoea batatas]
MPQGKHFMILRQVDAFLTSYKGLFRLMMTVRLKFFRIILMTWSLQMHWLIPSYIYVQNLKLLILTKLAMNPSKKIIRQSSQAVKVFILAQVTSLMQNQSKCLIIIIN